MAAGRHRSRRKNRGALTLASEKMTSHHITGDELRCRRKSACDKSEKSISCYLYCVLDFNLKEASARTRARAHAA